MIKELTDYFNNTSPEKVKSDWEKSSDKDNIGPTMEDHIKVTNDTWRSVENLPTRSCKVIWKCIDGIEDIGFYYHKTGTFATIDLKSEKQITHWKPLI